MERTLPATWHLPTIPYARTLHRALWWGCLFAVLFMVVGIALTGYQSDAHNYWLATHRSTNDLYVGAWNVDQVTFVYSPAFAQVITPLGILPFAWFYALWVGLEAAALLWMTGPIIALPLLLWQPVQDELLTANVHLLIAAALVLGARSFVDTRDAASSAETVPLSSGSHHARIVVGGLAWAFILLTKVTPGVGALWFAVRREWRQLGIVLGVTGAIFVISVLIAGAGPWLEWAAFLRASPGNEFVPILPRVIVAAMIVSIGAWKGWVWTIVVAADLALPNFTTVGLSLSVFVALIGQWRHPNLVRAP